MAGDEDGNGTKRPIFTGDDLPDEPPIPSETEFSPQRFDDEDDFTPAPATGRLGLDDERLPWLESAEDIDAEEVFDSGRIIGFVLLSLVALAMIVGSVWLVSNRSKTGGEGSLIAAEAGPYKVPPQNPGGKTFEGTGDTSYVVAEGAARPGSMASESAAPPAPAPVATATAMASAAPAPGPSASASASTAPKPTPPAASGVAVQVGAYTSAADAEKGWSTIVSRNSVLSGLSHRVVEGRADFGRVFRLQAVTGDLAAANELCAKLKAAGQGCQVKR